MNTLLVLTLTGLSGWTYDGFASDDVKGNPRATAPPAVAPSSTAVSRSTAIEPAVAQPRPPYQALWRLTDASGQTWEHEDLLWLRRWVDVQNAAYRAGIVPPSSAQPATSGRDRNH